MGRTLPRTRGVGMLGGVPEDAFDFAHAPDPADAGWKSTLAEVDQARCVQMRISFLSNAENDLSLELSTLGFGFIQ